MPRLEVKASIACASPYGDLVLLQQLPDDPGNAVDVLFPLSHGLFQRGVRSQWLRLCLLLRHQGDDPSTQSVRS